MCSRIILYYWHAKLTSHSMHMCTNYIMKISSYWHSLSVSWLKMYFPFQNQAFNLMENINIEGTLCHYVILQILQDFGLYLWLHLPFFLLIFVVAEDVSLTGGAAIQRIRLIDEEEQVWPNIITFSVVNSSGTDPGLKQNLKSYMKA